MGSLYSTPCSTQQALPHVRSQKEEVKDVTCTGLTISFRIFGGMSIIWGLVQKKIRMQSRKEMVKFLLVWTITGCKLFFFFIGLYFSEFPEDFWKADPRPGAALVWT
jgi:hypothetical protein